MLERPVVDKVEAYSTSNVIDAKNALEPEGWSPDSSDKNPSITFDLMKDLPVYEVIAEVTDITEVIVVTSKDDEEVKRKPAEVGDLIV